MITDFQDMLRKVREITPEKPAELKIHPKALSHLRSMIPEKSGLDVRGRLYGIPIISCDWMPEDTGALIDDNGVHIIKFDINEAS